MDAARLMLLAAYCKIDLSVPEDKLLAERMYWSAVGYMNGAGVALPPAGTPRRAQYDQVVDAMVLDAWDNRGNQALVNPPSENPAFRKLINQLKQVKPVVPNSGTTGS